MCDHLCSSWKPDRGVASGSRETWSRSLYFWGIFLQRFPTTTFYNPRDFKGGLFFPKKIKLANPGPTGELLQGGPGPVL